MQAFPCYFLNATVPHVVRHHWDRTAPSLTKDRFQRELWPVDVGNYGFTRASSNAASAAAAREMGDHEVADRQLTALDEEYPAVSITGARHRPRASLWAHAVEGLSFLIATQPHARIHAVATLGVALLGMFLGVDRTEALWLGAAIALVWFAEALNTAVEHLCDVVSPEPNASVKRAKDIAAGAVLVVAIFSVFVGGLVFWPYLNSPLPVTELFHGR